MPNPQTIFDLAESTRANALRQKLARDMEMAEQIRREQEQKRAWLDTIKTRIPYETELQYFKANPNVGGMATSDNKAILNPYSGLSDEEKRSVLLNEKARVYMRSGGPIPDFSITEDQQKTFGEYGQLQDIKETIAGRIFSGDPSVEDATPEQKRWVDLFLKNQKWQP